MSYSLEYQRQTLREIQQRHAFELIRSGIAQKALKTRSTAAIRSPEGLPVVMQDISGLKSELYPNIQLYVFFLTSQPDRKVRGREANVADIKEPGSETEVVHPEEDFTLEDVAIVRGLAGELAARRELDLPNLSTDLTGIYER